MFRRNAVAVVVLGVLCSATLVAAQECKDSRFLTPLAGCTISWCQNSDFDAFEMQVSLTTEPRKKHVEGQIEAVRYDCSGKSALQVRRNAEQALKTAGYTIDFTGYDVPEHYVTSHKGTQWVAVVANEMSGDSQYTITAIQTGEMKQEMTASADAMAGAIAKTGRVAVYGIEFDTGKATLRPQSEKVLADVLAVLNGHQDWKMTIEGHTDSTGTAEGNAALSRKRADSVVAWLTTKGVAPGRLASVGYGDSKPVADNSSVDGRAKNRRVELVKQ